jgi:hypothetical protein
MQVVRLQPEPPQQEPPQQEPPQQGPPQQGPPQQGPPKRAKATGRLADPRTAEYLAQCDASPDSPANTLTGMGRRLLRSTMIRDYLRLLRHPAQPKRWHLVLGPREGDPRAPAREGDWMVFDCKHEEAELVRVQEVVTFSAPCTFRGACAALMEGSAGRGAPVRAGAIHPVGPEGRWVEDLDGLTAVYGALGLAAGGEAGRGVVAIRFDLSTPFLLGHQSVAAAFQ